MEKQNELNITILNDLVKRVSILESKINEKTKSSFKGNPLRKATDNQLIALSNQGVDITNIKTHQDVSKAFEEINNRQEPEEKPVVEERELKDNEEDRDLFPEY